MDPNEIEFINENRTISIIPNFNLGTIHLLSGSVGPFKAGATLNVPLWLAVSLKQQQKCRIMCPDWMELEKLETIKENEKLSRTFHKMANNHYMDEAHILMDIASDDIPSIDSVRTAIKDIWDIRMSKLSTSLDELFKAKSGVHAVLNNLTVMELNSIRPLLPHTMDQLFRIRMSRTNSSVNTVTRRSESHLHIYEGFIDICLYRYKLIFNNLVNLASLSAHKAGFKIIKLEK